jgi:hypothetical protein
MNGLHARGSRIRKVLGAALLGVHGTLALWAAAGLVELVVPAPPWPAVSNPELPRGVLVVHWVAMLGAGSTFLAGYLTRWPATLRAMVIAYAALASVCAVETFGYLTNESRFVGMAVEYATYGILITLLRRHLPARVRSARVRSATWLPPAGRPSARSGRRTSVSSS